LTNKHYSRHYKDIKEEVDQRKRVKRDLDKKCGQQVSGTVGERWRQ